jgi:hypothetical protein
MPSHTRVFSFFGGEFPYFFSRKEILITKFLQQVETGNQKPKRLFLFKLLIFGLQPNLAKFSCGQSLVWLHH